MPDKKFYVFHKQKETDEVNKVNYENICANTYGRCGTRVTYSKDVYPFGSESGKGYMYLNLGQNEGEVYYNTVWLYEDNLQRAKSIFYDNEIEKLKKEQQRIMKRIETLEKLK